MGGGNRKVIVGYIVTKFGRTRFRADTVSEFDRIAAESDPAATIEVQHLSLEDLSASTREQILGKRNVIEVDDTDQE